MPQAVKKEDSPGESPDPSSMLISPKDRPVIIYRDQGQDLRVKFEPLKNLNCIWYKRYTDQNIRKQVIDLPDCGENNMSIQGGIIRFHKLTCQNTGIYELELCNAEKMNISMICSFGLLVKNTDINWKKVGISAGIGAGVTAGAAVIAAPIAIAAVGFGSAGVVGGSMAAAWQATIGNVALGSFFAGLQSAGAAGMGVAATGATAATGAAAGAGIGGAFSKLVKSDAQKKYEEDEHWMKDQLGITDEE